MIIIFLNIADNMRLSILHPEINNMRLYLDPDFLSSINSGGDYFYTCSLFFFCVSFFIWLNTKQKKVKWFSLIATVLTAVYICVFTLKASVVLFLFLSVVLIYYSKKMKSIMTIAIVAVVSGAIILYVTEIYSDIIIDYIISLSPNKRLTVRLVTLLNENDEMAQESTVTGRTNLYLLSFKTWLTNPLTFFMGIGDHYQLLNAAQTGIGQHASIPDTLARYGIIGFSLIVVMLKSCIYYFLSLFDKEYRQQVLTILIIFIVYGMVKLIFTSSLGCVLFLLLPLSAIVVNNRQSNLKFK